jgi:hypothetical protein
MDRHGSEKFDDLFGENTGEPGSLAEIVDKHAGDAIFLSGEDNGSVKGADGGLSDMVGELGQLDPDEDWEDRDDDELSRDAIAGVDITGTATGVARGFGSHLPLDIGSGGFQIEDMPDGALNHARATADAELDDYDDDYLERPDFDSDDTEAEGVRNKKVYDLDINIENED